MNKNVLIAFGGATMIALFVAMLLSAMLKGGGEEAQVAAMQETPKTQILVATKAIAVGNLLSADNIGWKTWPEEAAFPGTVRRTDDQAAVDALSGRAIRPFAVNEPILKTGIVSNDGGFLAAALEPGYRAVAVSVVAATMAGGFINPGDYVDVMLTYSVPLPAIGDDETVQAEMQRVIEENVNRYATETVLENVKVLAVDQRAVKDEEASAKVGKTVTLQVTERQAQIVSLANQMGDLSLSLRALGDDSVADDNAPVVSDARIIRLNKELSERMEAIAETAGARQHNVRIYNGNEVINLPTR